MIKKILLPIFLIAAIIPFQTKTYADRPFNDFKAAFIRNNDLWIKNGTQENRITNGGDIRYPKWSPDGNWLAYLKGSKGSWEFSHDGELWLYNMKMNKHVQVKAKVNNNFQWSPRENKVSFLVNKDLFVLNTEPIHPFLANQIAANVENFSWYPNGKDLLFSAKESTQLYSDIILSKTSLETNRQKPVIKHIYTIPVGENEYYISTSQFKWSPDNKWVSFLLNPTASLSADTNTLCLLSHDGQVFKEVDEMLNYEVWFQWAPTKNVLGYINGYGRVALKNKQLTTITLPSFHKGIFTRRGFAARDFSWKNNHKLYVSRSKESALVDVNKRPLPSIYKITNKQKQVTFPAKNEGDFSPQIANNHLFWIRTDRQTANILVSPLNDPEENKWIKNITLASWYYEKWNWEEVFSLYKG
ncbi:DPP IV N-terminal domain-containing protein [Neobacillus soli]|uniref:DPP IV N-terminal domain-containing protein n=1 Tax=Neobacillus soli TaxID=220688 RepID=UPI0008245446|nr:DPP IV N-terminal domain-containing protein [Neobacillus soli]